MVSGAVALLLQDEPNLTPDQVKHRLMATANKTWPGYNAAQTGAGYLDINAAVNGTTTQSANTGLPASQLLWTGPTPVNWGSVQWGSVQWVPPVGVCAMGQCAMGLCAVGQRLLGTVTGPKREKPRGLRS